MRLRTVLLILSILLASLAGAVVWLLASANGLQTASQLAMRFSGGQLQIEQASGRLIGPLQLGALRWQTPALTVNVEQISLDWSPGALFERRLQIAALSAERLHIVNVPSPEPSPPPSELLLNVAVNVDKLAISRLEYGNALSASELAGSLHSDGRQHRLSDFRVRFADIDITAEATLDGAAPLQLAASARLSGQFEQRPMALALTASGPLEKIDLQAIAEAGLSGRADVVLTPFAPAAFASARLALDEIDPAAWQSGAPQAQLSLRADLLPQGHGVAGRFRLDNRQPGKIDLQRLPLIALSGHLDWQGERAKLDALSITLPGKGELSGRGQWLNGTLDLDLAARQLDAAQLVSTLRSTRLSGPISASLSANHQAVKLALQDARFRLKAEVSHTGGKLSLPMLEVAADQALLSARGELALDEDKAFTAEGLLSRFDPSRFAKVPAASINARFKTTGKLAPRPIIDASFALQESLLAGHAFTGQGSLRVDWPHIPQADIALHAGPNHLTARGAFGRPGDALAIDIDAPQLASYGLEGGISGRLDLGGSVQKPQLTANLNAAQLGLPGSLRLKGLTLVASIAEQPDSPLQIDLQIARLETPAQAMLAKSIRVQGEGNNRAHRLRASVELAGENQLSVALEGGLDQREANTSWQGRLLEASLKAPDKARNVQLTAPANLLLSAQRWSFGPAQLSGNPLDWQATLQAAADPQQLRASLNARGPRVGKVDGQLTAGMAGAWSLAAQMPWQGSLKTDIADLGWVAELIGEEWQSEGRFNGELQLAGTPATPLYSGRFRGEKLALRLAGQGLHLANGDLAIELDANRLQVKKLRFDSLQKPPPRPLRLTDREAIAALTRDPGWLEISGEMQVDRNMGADRAFLDVKLERLGAFQLPDQWLLLSGDGRLSWQGDTLSARGKLAVDAGYWQLAPGGAPRLSEDVIIKRPGEAPPPSSLRPKLNLDITTDLGRNFLFQGAGLSSLLSGNVRLRASGRDLPRASGSIRTRAGRFDAYGQQLSIERGILTFQGLIDNPALDVRAVRKGLSVEPGVQISGTAQKPIIKLISDPDLPEAEKLAWLVLGHGPEQMGAGDATVLLSAAGGLLGNESGNVVQQLKTTFGIDEFGLRQGDISSAGGRQAGSRVAGSSVDTTAATGNQIFSVGKRLSSNALLSYEQSIGKAESIVKLTVNLSRQVAVIGRAGSDNALDIFYTLSFGGPARRTRSVQQKTGVDQVPVVPEVLDPGR
jgi:translocation and assembly module TamB